MRLERFVANSLHLITQLPAHDSKLRGKALAQTLISGGDVMVNGEVVRQAGWQVFVGSDHVQICGEAAPVSRAPRLFVLHKPAGVLGVLNRQVRTGSCDGNTEPASLADLVPAEWWSADLGLFGRLDSNTTGLCILGRQDVAGIGALSQSVGRSVS